MTFMLRKGLTACKEAKLDDLTVSADFKHYGKGLCNQNEMFSDRQSQTEALKPHHWRGSNKLMKSC